MIQFIDDRIATVVNDKFQFPIDRVIYGELPVARNYWIRYNNHHQGTQFLPYMAFFRRIRFNPEYRKGGQGWYIDAEGNSRQTQFAMFQADYMLEIIDGHNIAKGEGGIVGQNNYFKRYMLWASNEPKIKLTEGSGTHNFRIIAQDPEDNSELELEEEGNGFIRSTFNFTVDGLWLDESDHGGVIESITSRIHMYNGTDIFESVNVSTDIVTGS